MLYRVVYRTEQPVDRDDFVNDKTVIACAVSKWENHYYTYIETDGKDSDIYNKFDESERMYEIFHYVPLLEKDEWISDRKGTKGNFRFIKLRPEMFASYIFQHFRYQEEARGERTKHTSIFCFGNQLAIYEEPPYVKIDPKIEGSLSTNDTDYDNWQEYMNQHFMPGDKWTHGEYIYSYYVEKED